MSNNGIVRNGFYIKNIKNKTFYVFINDETVKDYVGKWIDTPKFLR